MRKNTPLLALATLAVALGVSSCDRFTHWRKVTWDHYATGFYLETDMRGKEIETGCLEVNVKDYTHGIEKTSRSDLLTVTDLVYMPAKRSRLEDIIVLFGEATHQARTYEGYTRPHQEFIIPARYFLRTPIDKVEVTSDIDWGDEAPQGTVLNDRFLMLGRCHDRYAKWLDNPGRQQIPSGFSTKSKGFMTKVQEAYKGTGEKDWDRLGLYEVILSPLSEVDFKRMDYLEPDFYLTSECPSFYVAQTLMVKVTFRDGSIDIVAIVLPDRPADND